MVATSPKYGLAVRFERRDDLVAAVGHGVGVAGDLVEQTAGARRGVVDLVDVGAQLAAARGHAVAGVPGADPGIRAGGVDEQLLDRGRRRRLQRRHRGGSDQDAVERHASGSRGGAAQSPVR